MTALKGRWMRASWGIGAGVCLLAAVGRATTIHVATSGSNTPPYDTYAKAAHGIEDAVGAVSGPGDTVLIHAGKYIVDTTIWLPEGLDIVGIHRDSVTLAWNSRFVSSTMLRGAGDHALSGITFVNPAGGGDPEASAVTVAPSSGNLTVWNCRFDWMRIRLHTTGNCEIFGNDFLVRTGDGILVSESNRLKVHENVFWGGVGNAAGGGTGIEVLGGEVLIENNMLDWLDTQAHGVPLLIDDPPAGHTTIRNNIVRGGQAAIWWFYGVGTVENNLLTGPEDSSPYFGGNTFRLDFDDTLIVRNNVFLDVTWEPYFANDCGACPPTGPITYVHNAFWPPRDSFAIIPPTAVGKVRLLDSANFNAFPMFVGDSTYHLQFGSPLIDAGDRALSDADSTRSDIGPNGGPWGAVYEYLDLVPLAPESLSVTGEDTAVRVRWAARPETDLAGYRLYRGDETGFWVPTMPPAYELGGSVTDILDQGPFGTDTLFYVVTSVDRAGQESAPSPEVEYIISGHPVNHPPEWAPISPQQVLEGDTLRLRVIAADPDGDSLILSAVSLPANATFADSGDGSGLLQFQPDTNQAGDYTIELVAWDGAASDSTGVTVRVTEKTTPPPFRPGILRVYPNPLNSSGTAEVLVPGDAATARSVKLVLHDLLGRTVACCYEGVLTGGLHVINFDLSKGQIGVDLASGVYFLRLQGQSGTIGELAKIAVLN